MDRNKRQWTFIGIGILIILFLGVGYKLGYRITNNFTIGKLGTITITLPFSNTSIFIDNNEKILSSKDNEIANIKLSPKTHTIIVSKESYFPWTKMVNMPSNGKINLSPIFVSQNATGQIINANDPEYWKIKNSIETSKLPTKDFPLVSSDKSVSIWVENNAIISEVGNSIHTVIQPTTIINDLSFYKNRSDALIFSTENSVFMIEIDTENTQNFMPIYTGQNPRFIESSPDYIYVEDNSVLMQVII
jgi:hypothetical protein